MGWGEGRPSPFLAAATVAVIWNLGMLIYLLSKYADDFDAAPDRLLLALVTPLVWGLTLATLVFWCRARRQASRTWRCPEYRPTERSCVSVAARERGPCGQTRGRSSGR